MQNVSEQFGAKATASLKGRFHSARVRLTIMYVAILAAILCISSYTIYTTFSGQLQHRFHDNSQNRRFDFSHLLGDESTATPSSADVQNDLVRTLIIVNGVLLVLAGVSSYFLAGITLVSIQDAYERQRQFLGDASHELRTPLTILKTDLENELDDKNIKKSVRERAESQLEEVERMSHMVRDLLQISRLDEQVKYAMPTGSWNLNAAVQDIADRLQPISKAHGISLEMNLLANKKTELLLNGELFSQALTNVVKNAIVYNKENGSVTVATRNERSQVKIIISDTGIGMEQKELKKIFDRFYRVDASRSRQSGGSGLGLSIVQSATDKLGGTVRVQSEVGKGTEITFTFSQERSNH